jgi:hypothetical protein
MMVVKNKLRLHTEIGPVIGMSGSVVNTMTGIGMM